eukprot:gene4935-biopygen8709
MMPACTVIWVARLAATPRALARVAAFLLIVVGTFVILGGVPLGKVRFPWHLSFDVFFAVFFAGFSAQLFAGDIRHLLALVPQGLLPAVTLVVLCPFLPGLEV